MSFEGVMSPMPRERGTVISAPLGLAKAARFGLAGPAPLRRRWPQSIVSPVRDRSRRPARIRAPRRLFAEGVLAPRSDARCPRAGRGVRAEAPGALRLRSRSARCARRARPRRAGCSGEARPLDGIPATLKENIATRGTPVPLGTAARAARSRTERCAARGAPARGRRDRHRQDDDARLRHAVVRAFELPPADAKPVGPCAQSRGKLRRGGSRCGGRVTAPSTSAPTSAARSASRQDGAALLG